MELSGRAPFYYLKKKILPVCCHVKQAVELVHFSFDCTMM